MGVFDSRACSVRTQAQTRRPFWIGMRKRLGSKTATTGSGRTGLEARLPPARRRVALRAARAAPARGRRAARCLAPPTSSAGRGRAEAPAAKTGKQPTLGSPGAGLASALSPLCAMLGMACTSSSGNSHISNTSGPRCCLGVGAGTLTKGNAAPQTTMAPRPLLEPALCREAARKAARLDASSSTAAA